jgi:hypothetical protein
MPNTYEENIHSILIQLGILHKEHVEILMFVETSTTPAVSSTLPRSANPIVRQKRLC